MVVRCQPGEWITIRAVARRLAREELAQAATVLRNLLTRVETGDLVASSAVIARIEGAIIALEQLIG